MIERVAGKDYTTLAEIERMRGALCRVRNTVYQPPGMIFESLPCDTSRLRERRLIQNGIYNNWARD